MCEKTLIDHCTPSWFHLEANGVNDETKFVEKWAPRRLYVKLGHAFTMVKYGV